MPFLLLLFFIVWALFALLYWAGAAITVVAASVGWFAYALVLIGVKLILRRPFPDASKRILARRPPTRRVWNAFLQGWKDIATEFNAWQSSPKSRAAAARYQAEQSHKLALKQQAWDQAMRDYYANPIMHPGKPRKKRPT